MSDLYWLTDDQMARLEPYFPKSRGKPRVDDGGTVLSRRRAQDRHDRRDLSEGAPHGIAPCIPGRKSRAKPVKYDKRRYKCRNRIEIMFGRLKDWRRVATRYDRCPTAFFSAIALATTVIFWLISMGPDRSIE